MGAQHLRIRSVITMTNNTEKLRCGAAAPDKATVNMNANDNKHTSLTDASCEAFSRSLAAKTSVPGGGGAAAYVGALAAALCAMSGNFTLGKKKYAEVEGRVCELTRASDDARVRLLELIDEDAQAFYPLSEAYSISRDNPARAEIIEERTKAATQPPLEMMQEIAHVVELLEEMCEIGSRMLISDVGCGAAMAGAALQAASMNVFVNTKVLQDLEFAACAEQKANELLEYVARAQRVFEKVNSSVRSK